MIEMHMISVRCVLKSPLGSVEHDFVAVPL